MLILIPNCTRPIGPWNLLQPIMHSATRTLRFWAGCSQWGASMLGHGQLKKVLTAVQLDSWQPAVSGWSRLNLRRLEVVFKNKLTNYRWYIDDYREWFQCVSTTGLFSGKAILFVQIPVLAYSTEGDFSKLVYNFLLNPELCGSIDALQLRSLSLSCETLVAPRRLHWMTLILKLHPCHSQKL